MKSVQVVSGWLVGVLVSLILSIIPSKKDRVRVVVMREDGKVLLVRGYISRQRWALPGGGARRGETCQQAALREVYEETGVKVDRELRYLGRVKSREAIFPFSVRVFFARAETDTIRCNGEIIEAQWMPRSKVPREYESILQI